VPPAGGVLVTGADVDAFVAAHNAASRSRDYPVEVWGTDEGLGWRFVFRERSILAALEELRRRCGSRQDETPRRCRVFVELVFLCSVRLDRPWRVRITNGGRERFGEGLPEVVREVATRARDRPPLETNTDNAAEASRGIPG
jgi:hypothetical protein